MRGAFPVCKNSRDMLAALPCVWDMLELCTHRVNSDILSKERFLTTRCNRCCLEYYLKTPGPGNSYSSDNRVLGRRGPMCFKYEDLGETLRGGLPAEGSVPSVPFPPPCPRRHLLGQPHIVECWVWVCLGLEQNVHVEGDWLSAKI